MKSNGKCELYACQNFGAHNKGSKDIEQVQQN